MEVRFLPAALQDLTALDTSIMRRVVNRIVWLAANWGNVQPQRLSGDLSDFYKLRVGDYRVLYQILAEENALLIHQIGHRREIYN